MRDVNTRSVPSSPKLELAATAKSGRLPKKVPRHLRLAKEVLCLYAHRTFQARNRRHTLTAVQMSRPGRSAGRFTERLFRDAGETPEMADLLDQTVQQVLEKRCPSRKVADKVVSLIYGDTDVKTVVDTWRNGDVDLNR